MARNNYQKLVHAKSRFCKGEILKSEVKRAASNYVHGAAIKSKDQAKGRKDAERVANRVLRAGCKISPVITGRKKKKKKSAKRK